MGLLRVFAFTSLAGAAFACALWLSTPDVRPLASGIPGETAFMRLRKAEAAEQGKTLRIRRQWVTLAAISPRLQDAVVVSEDGAFFEHEGIDWEELRLSLEKNLRQGRIARGGSTITQQLAKNLYLSPSRNPVRKLREALIARELEAELSKSRILELYLNSIEWGDGIFGAEAAARHYFRVPARNLSAEQAATLAAIIPNPRKYGKNLASRVVRRRKAIILRRMNRRTAPSLSPAKGAGLEPLPSLDDQDEPAPPPRADSTPRAEVHAPTPPAAAPQPATQQGRQGGEVSAEAWEDGGQNP